MIPGHQITITDGNSSRQAFALEICRDGRLKVREEDGQETILSFGEDVYKRQKPRIAVKRKL